VVRQRKQKLIRIDLEEFEFDSDIEAGRRAFSCFLGIQQCQDQDATKLPPAEMSDQAAQLASQNLVDAAQQPTISQQTQQGVAQAAQAATPPAAQAPANSADGDNLVCQWTGCGQRWPNPVRLYVSLSPIAAWERARTEGMA